jgi:alanine racemase
LTQSLAPQSTARSTRPAGPSGQRSYLEIDLSRLESNVARLGQHLGENATTDQPAAKLCAVVKKQAYGLGAVPIAQRLIKAGTAMLAVYDAAEAAELVTAGITAPILVLMPVRTLQRTDALYRHAARERLHLAVHAPDQLDELNELGHSFGLRLPVHLYLDTGMSRAGLNDPQFAEALSRAREARFVRLAGVYSHLATADADPDFAQAQHRHFEQALSNHAALLEPETIRHLANTSGTLRSNSLHYDMVRAGLGVLGYGPPQLAQTSPAGQALAPVLRWISQVTHIQWYPAGATVSYGATDQLQRESLLAIVPVGYGDGYPLALSNQATMRVQAPDGSWHDAPVRGRVSMDQTVVDLTDVPAPADALMNQPVEVYSNDPQARNSLTHMAALAETHCYELLCRLSPQLKRCYIHD